MKKYCQGFVDIISLIAVVFLVATITTVTFVTNKEDANFDIREKAVTTCLEPCVSDSECGNGYYCYKPATGCAVCKIKTPTPTITTPPTPVPTSNACISNSRCLGPGESCCGSEYFDNTCSLTETRCGNPPATKTPTSKPTTTPTPIPTIEPCSGAMQQECSERGQYCVPDDIGGHCESPTKTCEPELVQNLSCLYGKRQQNWLESNCATNIRLVSDASCIQTTTTTTANCINKPDVCNSSKGLNYCKDGIYYSKTCPNGYTCPVGGNACVATTITQSDCDKCLATNSVSECQGACGNIGNQIVNDSCTPNKNECFFGNLRTCSSSGTKGLTTCSNGCDEVNNVCKPNLLAMGKICNSPEECTSGYCYPSISTSSEFTFSPSFCQSIPYEQYQKEYAQGEQQAATIATVISLSFIPGVGPLLQVIGAANSGINAYYTCSQLYEASNNSDIPEAQLNQLKTQCGLNIAATATSIIAGRTMLNAGSALTTTQALINSGINLLDSSANTAITSYYSNIVCATNPYSSDCLQSKLNVAISFGGMTYGAYGTIRNTSTIANNWYNSQIDNTFNFNPYSSVVNYNGSSLGTSIENSGKMFNASSELNGLVYASTGGQYSDINDPEFIIAMMNDPTIIRAKYHLPSIEMRYNDPQMYIQQLTNQIQQTGTEVTDIRNYESFMNDVPGAGGFFTNGNLSDGFSSSAITANFDDPGLPGVLTHEAVHMYQNQSSPGMPIEVREYEAYLSTVGNSPILMKGDMRDIMFGWKINASSQHFYDEQGLVPIWK